MTRVAIGLLTCTALLTGCTSFVARQPTDAVTAARVSGTRILVTVPQAAEPGARLVGAPGQSYLRRRNYGPAPAIDHTLDRIARDYDLQRLRGWRIDSIGVYCEVFEVPAARDSQALVEALLADPRIDLAQPMNYFETLGHRYDDPFMDLQTSLQSLAIEAAHRIATGRGVAVAVIDSQIDTRHPELKERVRQIRDLVDGRLRHSPEVHGTAVAGVIASAVNNEEGIVGIAPDADLVALRACWSDSAGGSSAHCSSFSLAQALEVALGLDVQVINLSLAGPADPLIASMLDVAIHRGIVVVAARAERAPDDLNFPASHRGVIAVSAADSALPAAAGALVVYAPGREILTTAPGSSYAFFSGNSLAAAHVTGVAALLRERMPDIQPAAIVRLLNETSERVGANRSINACLALERLTATGSTRARACDASAPTLASAAK